MTRHSAASVKTSAKAPDLAEAARQAVVGFLHDASVATAERESARPPGAAGSTGVAGSTGEDTASPANGVLAAKEDADTWSAASAGRPIVAESAAVRAAATGLATLERIEAAAAKVEEDIAAALRAHAELQAGAGQAAEAAVRAAQDAWVAAGSAVEADRKARISLHLVARYVTITMALLFVAIVVLVVTATTVH
ncbi:MAG TPA: hypothetical protein VMR14_13600 [Streptosporangiaceae bacterium]|jgi:hypothetical protein|nr:hypothetical protein [Streptosporangiaceae bacterium]